MQQKVCLCPTLFRIKNHAGVRDWFVILPFQAERSGEISYSTQLNFVCWREPEALVLFVIRTSKMIKLVGINTIRNLPMFQIL